MFNLRQRRRREVEEGAGVGIVVEVEVEDEVEEREENTKRKMLLRSVAYSLVCGILAVGNRNQTFLQFTTNHLEE
jgi:hypothetical protein